MSDPTPIKTAFIRESFPFAIQPVFKLSSSKPVCTGGEVLARKWGKSQTVEDVTLHTQERPHEFLGDIEANNQLPLLDLFMLDRACRFLSDHRESLPADIAMNVNMSPETFASDGLSEKVNMILRQHKITPPQINIEILEDEFIHPFSESRIFNLKRKGFGITLDDYGVKASDNRRIKNIRPDTVKIDRSLVKPCQTQSDFEALLDNKSFEGRMLVLEGIRLSIDDDAFAYLSERGDIKIQGNMVHEPLSSSEFLHFMTNGRTLKQGPSAQIIRFRDHFPGGKQDEDKTATKQKIAALSFAALSY
ncbi:MAG: EAL domain-containing protein [Alphaproteobacteria bacterium]|nr:EAL domain-containing protein [Alphaproteobacteria bacterium]